MSKIVTYQEQALEQRRQEALKVAQRCIQLLKQEFGATDFDIYHVISITLN